MSLKLIAAMIIVCAAIGQTEAVHGDESASNAASAETTPLQELVTTDGIQFTIFDTKPSRPAPTLFVLALDAKTSLGNSVYRRCGNLLTNQGFLCVSVDLPCHGSEQRTNEPEGIDGWRMRVEAGDDPLADLNSRLTKVLDFLIEQHLSDPERIVVCGSSRGGFAALLFAAAEPRVKAVAAFSPVTELLILREFQGLQATSLPPQLTLENHLDKLAARPVWIMIGDRDQRVGTDYAIKFARQLSAKATAGNLPSKVELHVCPSNGHHTPTGADEQSANWIVRQLAGNNN